MNEFKKVFGEMSSIDVHYRLQEMMTDYDFCASDYDFMRKVIDFIDTF